MKKILFLFLAGVFILSAHAQQWVDFSSGKPASPALTLVTSDAKNVSFELTIPGIYTLDTVVNGVAFTRLILPDGFAVNPAGSPELPVLSYKVAIPDCDGVKVKYQIISTKAISSCWVYPVPEMRLGTNGEYEEQFVFNATVYAQPCSPEPVAVVSTEGAFRAQHYVEARVQPVVFCPVTQQLSVIDKVEVTLIFDNPISGIRQNVGIFNKVAANTFINYEDDGISALVNDKAFAKVGFTPGNVSWINLTDTAEANNIVADYLIITVPDFFEPDSANSQLLRLATHRAFYNAYDVAIVNVEDILSLNFYYEGNPDPYGNPNEYIKEQKMRTFIRRVYEGKNAHHSHNPYGDGHLAFVLLVGDNYGENEGMPTSKDNYESFFNETYPSDHYFSCITKTGSTYGELGSLFIGRLSVEDSTQLYNMVEKTIYHETGTDGAWRKTAGVTIGNINIFDNQYCESYFNFMSNLLDGKGWNHHYVLRNSIRDSTLSYLNTGVAFAQYIGGPSPVYGPSGWEDNLIEDTLQLRLHNEYQAPFVNAMYCQSSHFDDYDCFGEFMTRYSNKKGAVGYIGVSRKIGIGHNYIVDTTKKVFQEQIPYYLFEKNSSIAGELLLTVKNILPVSHQTSAERHGYSLLGDPALNILAEPDSTCRKNITNTEWIHNGDVLIVPCGCELHFYQNGKLIVEEGGAFIVEEGAQIFGELCEQDTVIHIKGGGFTVGENVVFNNLKGILLENTELNLNYPGTDATYNYVISKQYDLRKITFNNTPVRHYYTKLNISNCTFNQGSHVKSAFSILEIENCTFHHSTLLSENAVSSNSLQERTTISNCLFTGNNNHTALQLNTSQRFLLYYNTITGYKTGISITASGTTLSQSIIPTDRIDGNKVSFCSTGIELYNSAANFVRNNISNNDFGVRLYNNSYTFFDSYYYPEQFIKDCASIELYASSNSFPVVFRCNKIIDEDNLGNSYNDPLIYWEVNTPYPGVPRNVNFNDWGNHFNPLDDLYPSSAFICDIIGCPGKSTREMDEELYQTGLTYFANEDYANAEAAFKELIANYPQSQFAIGALHELFAMQQFTYQDYASLYDYYATITSENSALFDVADFLATRCNVMQHNWQPAVDWYEYRIENPPSYQDSVFAVIDLGDIHLMMEADTLGSKSGGVCYYSLPNIKPKSKREYEQTKSSLLATLPQIKKPQISDLTSQINKKGALGQNVPNPATGTTTINYEIYAEGYVEISIYNLYGQLVKSLPQGNLSSGNYQATISLSGISAGMYHYALLVNGERTDTKKMVVN